MSELVAYIERHPWWTLVYLGVIFGGGIRVQFTKALDRWRSK